MTATLQTAPVLSTPDTHIFEDPTPIFDYSSLPRLSDEQVNLTYEIERTVKEIRAGRWTRIALQFPDQMLVDAPRVYEALRKGLENARNNHRESQPRENETTENELATKLEATTLKEGDDVEAQLFIMGDTSYGACCVDEVAAEHVDADVVVHYGRSCLSPPSRLPVIYVFTSQSLDLDVTVSTFHTTYPDKDQKVILMADIPYSHHIAPFHARLQSQGYTNIHATEIVYNPSSPLPNRTVPTESKEELRSYQLFHISEPPTSLLLTLSSRVSAIHIYPTDTPANSTSTPEALLASSAMTLRRRYAILTSLSSAPVFGILINTLSVKNYMHILSHVKAQIAAAGKKSYTFVVGKVNAAKVANFSEIMGWVVIGCWESSLIESKEFWRPIITPFELGLTLQSDEERIWTGEWTGDFQAILKEGLKEKVVKNGVGEGEDGKQEQRDEEGDYDSEEESAPPEFDLRTGRYVSSSRPMRSSVAPKEQRDGGASAGPATNALTKRFKGDLAHVGGVVSPGAEFLRSQRTWQGLGTDYAAQDEGENENASGHGARMEEGRSGIARGYHVGDDTAKH